MVAATPNQQLQEAHSKVHHLGLPPPLLLLVPLQVALAVPAPLGLEAEALVGARKEDQVLLDLVLVEHSVNQRHLVVGSDQAPQEGLEVVALSHLQVSLVKVELLLVLHLQEGQDSLAKVHLQVHQLAQDCLAKAQRQVHQLGQDCLVNLLLQVEVQHQEGGCLDKAMRQQLLIVLCIRH